MRCQRGVPPGAAAAVIGVRLLSSRLDQLVSSIGTLFESSVFLDDLQRFLSLGRR